MNHRGWLVIFLLYITVSSVVLGETANESEEFAWKDATAEDTERAYYKFLQAHRNGKHGH